MTKQLLFFIPLLALLAACDGNTDTIFEVENETSDTLYFKWIGIRYDTSLVESEMILPNSTHTVLYESTLGGRKEVPAISEYMGNPYLTNAAGDTAQLDLANAAVWQITSAHRRKVPSNWQHRYRLNVTADDFD
jgi:hypothetical protein